MRCHECGTTAPAAVVFHDGNVWAAPTMRGAVLDQVNVGEQVELLGRSPDGLWLHISNIWGKIGWAHHTYS